MSGMWGFAAVLAVVAGAAVRELIELRRFTIRYSTLLRLSARAAPGTVIRDQDRDGAATWIAVVDPTEVSERATTVDHDGPAG
jgi:hypothetical protein